MRNFPREILVIAIASAHLTACAGRANHRPACVTPGHRATIEYKIHNPTSENVEGVEVFLVPPPKIPLIMTGLRIIEDPDLSPPINIPPGKTRTFKLSYKLGDEGDAIPEGNFTLQIKCQMQSDLGLVGGADKEFRYVLKRNCSE